MDERQSFLDAIYDDPDDHVRRLVFADWLQEHGDEARAEFIRIECAIAQAEDDLGKRSDAVAGSQMDEIPAWIG